MTTQEMKADCPIDALALEVTLTMFGTRDSFVDQFSDIALGILVGLGISVASPEWARGIYLDEIARSDAHAAGLGTGLRDEHGRLARRIAEQFPIRSEVTR